MALKLSISPKPFPDMANPAIEEDVLEDKEYINSSGEKKIGTFTIEEEVATQEDLITQALMALDSKGTASGGASIGTCNVTIRSFNEIKALSYTSCVNGVCSTHFISLSALTPVTLENIVCGSAITFINMYDFNGFTHSHDEALIGYYTSYMWVLSAPTEAGVNATIYIYDDD